MKSKFQIIIIATALILWGGSVSAEGMVDIKPYVGASVTYDDNVFRFSDSDQAEAAFGSSKMSDTITRTEVGLDIDLRLSRQLISLTSNINKNQYDHFNALDNVGKSIGLEWDWTLGSKLFGAIGYSSSEAITSFNDLRNLTKNLRTIKTRYASANWRMHPSWTASVSGSRTDSDNSEKATQFININRNIDDIQIGVQYINTRQTSLGFAYREMRTSYPDRVNLLTLAFLGDENKNKEFILNGAISFTDNLRVSSRVKHSRFTFNNQRFAGGLLPQRRFDGVSKQVLLDYKLSFKTSIGLNVFDEIVTVDDLIASYFRYKGFSLTPSWRPTEKIRASASVSINEREFLGDTGAASIGFVNSINRKDEIKSFTASVLYLPTQKSSIQLSYTHEDRESNNVFQNYDFNQIYLSLRYDL